MESVGVPRALGSILGERGSHARPLSEDRTGESRSVPPSLLPLPCVVLSPPCLFCFSFFVTLSSISNYPIYVFIVPL